MAPLLLALAALPLLPPQPEGVPWPTEEWPTGELGASVDAKTVTRLVEEAVASSAAPLGETRAVVVIHRGRLVLERYAKGFGQDTRLISWSVAKSITHAFVGVAAKQGLLDPDKPMGSSHWKSDDPRAQIPWRNWLQMNDGQDYTEFTDRGIAYSDAPRKLFGPGRLDVAGYCAQLPPAQPVGKHWNYNSCGVVLMDDALTNLVAPKADAASRRTAMREWMKAQLFDVLGMRSATPQFDAAGLVYGSSQIYATARDFARFGYLYLRGGYWGDRQLLPDGWADFARVGDPNDDGDKYGAGFWLTSAEDRTTKGQPADAFRALGFDGQVVMIQPSKDLVIVRLGRFGDAGHNWDDLAVWMTKLSAAFP